MSFLRSKLRAELHPELAQLVSALPVGAVGLREVMDASMADEIDPEAFVRMMNTLTEDRDFYLTELRRIMERLSDTTELEAERRVLDEQVVADAKAVNDLVARNARVSMDQAKFTKQYNTLVDRYEQTQNRQKDVMERIAKCNLRRNKIERFIQNLEGMPELFTEFDENLWAVMVKSITVYDSGRLVFHLTSGMDVEV